MVFLISLWHIKIPYSHRICLVLVWTCCFTMKSHWISSWTTERADTGLLGAVVLFSCCFTRAWCFLKTICWVSKNEKLWICRHIAKNCCPCCWNIPFHESEYWFITPAVLLKMISQSDQLENVLIHIELERYALVFKSHVLMSFLESSHSQLRRWRTEELFCDFNYPSIFCLFVQC